MFKDVVPIVLAGAEALDAGMESDHGVGHSVAGHVRIKATIDFESLIHEFRKPGRILPGSGGRYAQTKRVEFETAEGIYSGFAQDGGFCAGSWNREVAEVLL